MKKLAALVLWLILLLTVTACHFQSTQGNTQTEHIHAYNNQQVIAPTCEDDGYTLLICDCGATTRSDPKLKTGHDFVSVQNIEPTCTESGYSLMACRYCKKEQEEVIPAKGHDYETIKIVFPTEEEKAHIERTCHCGEVNKDFETPVAIKFEQSAEGHLYYYYAYSGRQSKSVLLVNEPVVKFQFAHDDRNLYFVKVAEPKKIYTIALDDLSQQKVLYESSYGTITDVCPDFGQDGFIHVTEEGKRFILLDLNTGDIQVILEVYSLQSAEAYFDDDGNISHVWLRGQPTENHKNYTYFYYPSTGEFQEHNG